MKIPEKNLDLGLLVLRVFIGASMLIFHGWGKLTGGPERWEGLGGAMASFGITFAPVFWGFMAAFAESVCSLLVILGFRIRFAAGLLAFTMLVAVIKHLGIPEGEPGAGWSGASHALEFMGVYLALLITGAGKYAVKCPFDKCKTE